MFKKAIFFRLFIIFSLGINAAQAELSREKAKEICEKKADQIRKKHNLKEGSRLPLELGGFVKKIHLRYDKWLRKCIKKEMRPNPSRRQ